MAMPRVQHGKLSPVRYFGSRLQAPSNLSRVKTSAQDYPRHPEFHRSTDALIMERGKDGTKPASSNLPPN